jgi:hypothetical protein
MTMETVSIFFTIIIINLSIMYSLLITMMIFRFVNLTNKIKQYILWRICKNANISNTKYIKYRI